MLIQCTGSKGNPTCSLISNATVGYHVSGDGDLIKCSGAAKCASVSNPSGYFIDAITNGNIIICDDQTHKCKSEVGSNITGHAYLDASDYKSQTIFNCPTAQAACALVTAANTAIGALAEETEKMYFVDGTDPTKLIICSGTGIAGKGKCEISQTPPIEDGNVLAFFNDEITAANTISCSDSGCISSKGKIL